MKPIKFGPVLWAITCLALLIPSSGALAAPEDPGDPQPPLALNSDLSTTGTGLTLVQSGVGLEGLPSTTTGGGSIDLTITINGTVNKAFLYWAGRARPFAPGSDGLDQDLIFDGTAISGTLIGEEEQIDGNSINNIGYRKDVTSIVEAAVMLQGATPTFTIEDGDTSSNLHKLSGATLLVVYSDSSDSQKYSVQVFDGIDFAFGRNDQPDHAQVTQPIMFGYLPESSSRTADLLISAGDAEATRPDRIDVTDSSTGTTSITNELGSADGDSWDALTKTITIPANVSSTTVQLFSPPPFSENPDSLLWEVGALRIPLECSGKIGDFVWDDTANPNGIQDVGEPGIEGVKVTLMDSGGNTVMDTTDANGKYLFVGLCSGTYTVSYDPGTVPPGFVPTLTDEGFDDSVDSDPSPVMVELVTDNSEDLTIDFGFELVTPPMSGSCDDGKPIELVFEYTGLGCEANPANPQGGKFTCSGDPLGAAPVQLVVEDANADPSTESIGIGDFVTITPSGDKFDSNTDFEIKQVGQVLQDLTLHLSCSQDLNVGDRFGSLTLRVFVPTVGGGGMGGMGGMTGMGM